ncbi:hypothetical protein D3C72_2516320 [compost metagenome]
MPVFDVLSQPGIDPGQPLIAAVNRAQYNAQRTGGGTFTPQRPGGGFTTMPTGWRNRPSVSPMPVPVTGGGRRGR